MNAQLALVAILVAGAALYLIRRAWRTWSGSSKAGCSGGCGCAGKTRPASNEAVTVVPVEELKLRRGGRRGP
jgi:hypothetical protein